MDIEKKIIYHGSDRILQTPLHEKGSLLGDFGPGFYCTTHHEIAKEWAVGPHRNGFVNQYSIHPGSMKVLDLTDEKHHLLNWLALVLKNRRIPVRDESEQKNIDYIIHTYSPDLTDVDIILGYRADDSFFAFIRAFLESRISVSGLNHLIMLGKLADQFVLVSPKAYADLSFRTCSPADYRTYYPRRLSKDRSVQDAFSKLLRQSSPSGLFIKTLIREEVSNEDPRLR